MEREDTSPTAGRKGVPYDWQQVIVDAAIERLDDELAALQISIAE